MKFRSVFNVISLSFLAGLVAQIESTHVHSESLHRHRSGLGLQRRTTSILNSPPAQPKLPTPDQVTVLNISDIQGDILVGMKKKQELFYFFGITDPAVFKSKLHTDIHPLVTSTRQMLSTDSQPTTALNLAFSNTGLSTLGITDSLSDSLFAQGQAKDASALGDPGTDNWVPGFVGTNVHGVFLLASDTIGNVNSALANLQNILGSAIVEIHRIQGAARPGSEEGHEHFGFMDGISQPAIAGFTVHPTPGQQLLPPGTFLLGELGDTVGRPSWAKDGSFLAFRQLKQLVPEFSKFLADNPIVEPGVLTADQGSALLGARMVGRWKSGAPVDLAPLFDDPALAADPNRNNDFTFAHIGENIQSNQTRCPFSAHIRKTNPRADFTPMNTANHIIRGGIPYGPEVTDAESASGVSDESIERGLAFGSYLAYQSNIGAGFHFQQQTWANDPTFFPGKSDPTPGVDPIIGALGGKPRVVSGLDPTNADHDMTLIKDFVVSKGGEYFFSPSLSAIRDKISV